jgi:hypothetical protein
MVIRHLAILQRVCGGAAGKITHGLFVSGRDAVALPQKTPLKIALFRTLKRLTVVSSRNIKRRFARFALRHERSREDLRKALDAFHERRVHTMFAAK